MIDQKDDEITAKKNESYKFKWPNKLDTFIEKYKPRLGNLLNDWSQTDTKITFLVGVAVIIWFSFETRLLAWIDYKILAVLFCGYENSGIALTVLISILILYGLITLPKRLMYRFFTPYRYLIPSMTMVLFYFYYKTLGYYKVRFQYFGTSILDIVFVAIGLYTFFAFLINLTTKKAPKQGESKGYKLYYDNPINENSKDRLGFTLTVKEFYEKINHTFRHQEHSISIGITGIWGEGKSSFINLLKNKFKENKDDYIVIEFNPRHAKSLQEIQFEFFQLLHEELKKYDARLNDTFSNYLKAINVIQSNSITDFIQHGKNTFFDKVDEKEHINKVISRIGKKIVIIIDDLDRLLSHEIIEVFKLIDGNASFKNIIFITAYDKVYVNNILQKEFDFADENLKNKHFTDKFFTIEQSLPFVPKSIYQKYLYDEISTFFKEDIKFNNKELLEVISQHAKSYEDLLNTIRNIKRFLNHFMSEYSKRKDHVEFEDFFLLSIIYIFWNDYYLEICNMKLFQINDENQDNKLALYLPTTLTDEKSPSLIEMLQHLENRERTDFSLNNTFTFDNYVKPVVNTIANPMKFDLMFDKSINENKKDLDTIEENQMSPYLTDYLLNKNIKLLGSKERALNFFELLVYQFNQADDVNLYLYLYDVLSNHENNDLIKYFKKLDDDYIDEIKKRLIQGNSDHKSKLSGRLLQMLVNAHKNVENFKNKLIFNKNELLDILKSRLEAMQEEYLNQQHLELLYLCRTDIDEENSDKYILDKDSCELVKDLILKHPEKYLDKFVLIHNTSFSCEPYCVQIFGGEDNVRNFLNEERHKNHPKIQLIRNAWACFRANNKRPIELNIDQEEFDQMRKVNFPKLADEANLALNVELIFEEIKKSLETVIELVKPYSYNSLNYKKFIYICKKENVNLESLLKDLKELMTIIKVFDGFLFNNFTINTIKNFDSKVLKLYLENNSELEQVISELQQLVRDDYNEDKY